MPNEYLEGIKARVEAGEEPCASVRTLLSWYGAQRRGYWIVRGIKRDLNQLNLRTDPSFEYAYIDSEIVFGNKPPMPEPEGLLTSPVDEIIVVDASGEVISGASDDATYRIGKLPQSNRKPVSLAPNDQIRTAVTIMMSRDFSQIPVMTTERELKGVISWRSIGRHLVLIGPATEVRQAMEPAVEVSAEASLFEALPLIVRHDYVLVRDREKLIQGIVTTSDLGTQFRELSEPFLLLGEIENHLRQVLDGKFTKEELVAARDPADAEREIGSIADLAFGEYIRVFEHEKYWDRCGLQIDRKFFLDQLHRVRELRNDIMHFDPDPLAEEDLLFLRDIARFMRDMKAIGLF